MGTCRQLAKLGDHSVCFARPILLVAGACMMKYRLNQVFRSAVMQEKNPLTDAPQRRGPELVAESKTLRDIICKARPHMMDEQIGKKRCFDIGKRWRLGD